MIVMSTSYDFDLDINCRVGLKNILYNENRSIQCAKFAFSVL